MSQFRLVGWEISAPFQHKNRLYRGQGFGWRFSSVSLRMANDTSPPRCLFVQQRPKMGKNRGEWAHLSYYANTYNKVETNQSPQDLFISWMWYFITKIVHVVHNIKSMSHTSSGTN